MEINKIKKILDNRVEKYNNIDFIETDPIQIPHMYKDKKDIEISAFLTSSISWGKRLCIIKTAKKLMDMMDNSPYEFIINFNSSKNNILRNFVYRTFNSNDLIFFLQSLKNIYINYGGLSSIFKHYIKIYDIKFTIHNFKKIFFINDPYNRASKHIGDPLKNSAAKKINMWLRWMVRKDNKGVDFGIWDFIPMSYLSCPLDVHSGNVARKLGLITRKYNDYKAVQELDKSLRILDPKDPCKYDYALFGLGIFENFY